MCDSFCSELTRSAINYGLRRLLQQAGVTPTAEGEGDFQVLGVPVYYGNPETLCSSRPAIILAQCDDNAGSVLLQKSPNSLHWMPRDQVIPRTATIAVHDSIPVLFWGKGYEGDNKPFAEQRADGSVVFYVDIVAATLFMLSRWEETVTTVRDEHGRFPSTASVAYKQGFLDRPLVDEYALILREWLRLLLPRWEPKPRSFTVKLSHDIDHIYRFPSQLVAFRTLGGDLLKRRDPISAWQTGVDAITQVMAPQKNSYFQGIYSLAEISKSNALGKDAFYFMAVDPNSPDCSYDPASPLVCGSIQDLCKEGFEIGLHAGYDTLSNPQRLAEEKARLDAVLGSTQYGGRQHYLRFQVPQTWRHWEQVGLICDATMGYADHEGFRCGTCHAFRPFDLEEDRELDIWEQPLIVMDQTLRRYRRLSPEQGEAQILKLAERCKRVDGTFTLLWHNSSLGREWGRWRDTYQRVVAKLAQMQSAASG
jgi:hypothetical protein